MVKRLFGIRRNRENERDERIRKNRGLGSTKTAYSSSYRDFQSQSLVNITHIYSGGDRSKSIRKLGSSALSQKLPPIQLQYKDMPKAIEYPGSVY